MMHDRRQFIISAGAVSAAATSFFPGFGRVSKSPGIHGPGDKNLSEDLVLDFVRGAHTDFAKTRELLQAEPKLLRAAWEWAPGDFETAIGAAAHSGSTDIVEYLLGQGAPYSIFIAAVLGHKIVVESIVKKVPHIVNAKGPHGIPLLDHAKAGGDAAEDVFDLLREKGAKSEVQPADREVSDQLANFIVGDYRLEADDRAMNFSIMRERDRIYVDAEGRDRIRLLFQGQTRFVLEGTPAEFIFEGSPVNQKKCSRIMVKEGYPIGFAERR